MTDTLTAPPVHGRLIDATTLEIQRLLPGPLERVWTYLTDSDLRRQWLASGVMSGAVGAPFTLTWRNSELTDPPGAKPADFGDEHSMASRITDWEPMRRLGFMWGEHGSVSMTLEPRGDRVLLSLTHRRLDQRSARLMVSAGWHAHLDVLAARLADSEPAPFWDAWLALRQDYDARLAP